jgi:AcrR family transcriptional regulator
MSRHLTEEAVDDFRRELCRVAARRFAEFGHAGITLRALAMELGCSRTRPYRYFKDKAQILGAVRTEGFLLLAQVQEAAASAESSAERRLEAVGRAYLRFAADEPDYYRLMFEVPEKSSLAPTPEQLAAAGRSQRPLYEAVKMAANAGVLQGNPTTVSHLLWAALHGVASLHLADKLRSGRTFEQLTEEMLNLLSRLTRTASDDPIQGVLK